MIESRIPTIATVPATFPNGCGSLEQYPKLLKEDELIRFLRIPDISKAKDYHNVIAHLKRYRKLPCIHICRTPLYPLDAVLGWIEAATQKEMTR